MKRIKLTQNKFALVDDEDYKRLDQYSWYCVKVRERHQYAYTTIKGKAIHMASMIMKPSNKYQVIHLDKNGLNNQKYNLKIASITQRNRSRVKQESESSSRYKGVSYDKSTGKWRSRILINYKTIYLGRYNNELEAAQAYDKAALKYFGEFAQLNLIHDQSLIHDQHS